MTLQGENELFRLALEQIRDERWPQVCAEFATCQHEGCAASYAAFVIADIALKPAEPPAEEFCDRDSKCYLRVGHNGECAKTKDKRRSYTSAEPPAEEVKE